MGVPRCAFGVRPGCVQNMDPEETEVSTRKRLREPHDEGTAKGKRTKVDRQNMGATGVRRGGCSQNMDPETGVSKRERPRKRQGGGTTQGKTRKALHVCFDNVGMYPGAVAVVEAEAKAEAAAAAAAPETWRASPLVLGPYVSEGVVLGEGGFGLVVRGLHTTNGEIVAIKELPAGSEGQHSAVARREVDILRRLSDGGKAHPHIVGFRGYFERAGKHYVVMEACLGGELFDQVAGGEGLSEEAGGALFAQLVAGLQHMHACGVAHLDLKLENVLVTGDGQLKIAG